MGIPEHLTCFLRNQYGGQEATVRTRHGTMDWFQIGKGVCQGCILLPRLFNFYAEYIMQNAGLDEAQAGIKIAGKVKVKVAQSYSTLQSHGLYSPWHSPDQDTGVGSFFLLQGIFPTQGSDPGLPNCRQILYQLSHKGSPRILEWVAYPSPANLPDPGIKLHCRRILYQLNYQDCWEKYQLSQICRWHHHYGRKWRRTKEPLDEREWKSWLKSQHSKNEDHGIWSHHFMANRWGNSGNSDGLSFLGLQDHCRWWLQPWN